MVDIVDLRIEAENLASERLVQVAEDIQGLGRTANRAQERLDELEITRQSLDSFIEARQRVNQLEEEVAQATVEYRTLQRELRNTSDATDEQRVSVARQQTTLRRLRSDLTRTNTEYRNLRESLRAVGVNTQAYRQEQARLAAETQAQRVEAQRLSQVYDQQTERLREQITTQRDSRRETERQADAERELRQERERQGAATAEQLSQQRRQREEQSRLTIATARYEESLQRLARAQANGNITRGQYIRGEARLRQQLQLTGSQIDVSRRAIEADTISKQNNTRSTDALTSVTRRLAQAYTVLIAAQTAAQSAIGNVQAYGQLEAAITNVERTTGVARGEVVALANEIRSLGEDVTPTSTNELLRFAEIAGQLGTTSTEDILSLVNAAEQLGVATNIAGDEAATLLSRILQSTGEGIPAIANLSSSVVELGNNFAAREDEIVNFTREIVTATRDINLSSAAAAGLGTALAVSGQRAEASRTAISRLSQAIRRAGTEGGESLQRLAEITGQTTDQLQNNLGERSEQIILDFVRGLQRVQEQGGVTLDVLRQFGIDGQEAAGVFNGLTAQVDTLASALDASANAYRDGLAQVREASNVYANQESAVGRLRNQFTNLREEIGRAFSDETNETINFFSDSLDGANDRVIELFEILPDVVEGIAELSGTLDGLFSLINTDGTGALEGLANLISVAFNTIDFAINGAIGSLQRFGIETAQLAQTISESLGRDFDTSGIENLQRAYEETAARANQAAEDIINANLRLTGESSRSYEDLVNAVDEYGGALSRLSQDERDNIDLIINKNGFIQGQDQLYRELTESLVRASRAQQIEGEQLDRIIAQRQADAEARREQITAIAESTQALNDNIAANINLNLSQEETAERIAEINQLRQDGFLADEVAANFIEILTTNLNAQAEAQETVTENTQLQAISAAELLEQNQRLNEQYEQGIITAQQLSQAQLELQSRFELTINDSIRATNATELYTNAQIRTVNAIQRTEQTLRDLRQELEAAANTDEDRLRITNRIIEAERELLDLRRDQVRQEEIAGATFQQLNVLRDQAEQQLARLNVQFQQGSITAAEYQLRQSELASTIAEITRLIGEDTVALRENTDAVLENAAAKTGQAEQAERVQRFVSLEAQAFQFLSQEFDLAGQSADELSQRVRELEGFIQDNSRVTSIWLQNLAEISNQGFRREQQIIRETLAIREWTAQVESGNLSLQQLQGIASAATRNVRELGDEQLEPLLRAIDRARSEFRALNDEINDALQDTQDRLDRIRGDEAAIVTRQFAREREELQALLDQALVSGNEALVRDVENALRNLQQAQRLEFEQQFGNNNQATNTNQNNTGGGTPQNNTGANRSNGGNITITINTPTGVQQIQVADQNSADALIATLGAFGTVSNQGNV